MFKSEFTSVDGQSRASLGGGTKYGAAKREWLQQAVSRHGHTDHKLSNVISPQAKWNPNGGSQQNDQNLYQVPLSSFSSSKETLYIREQIKAQARYEHEMQNQIQQQEGQLKIARNNSNSFFT